MELPRSHNPHLPKPPPWHHHPHPHRSQISVSTAVEGYLGMLLAWNSITRPFIRRITSFAVRVAPPSAIRHSWPTIAIALDTSPVIPAMLEFQALTYSHFCKYACSEEVPELQDMGGPAEGGFSIVYTNFTVGTIFGVWPGDKLTGVTGRDQVAAAMGIFGPRITYVLALKDCPGTHEFLLLDEGLNTNTVN
ncbi:sedoheptulose-1,7-bisphosphatase, chloroplastic-like [Lycium barbarum]|uniref:sedoheptulose-1,7-bisphosphatase, chloroplastic-like n=1 Tax=Lycium barbarum TaxID=112863 RepID=UPI00293E82F3|nr:sedoheptulose-1,7-bisphosphatase, chloroplastic-like [Lycium barbarum]